MNHDEIQKARIEKSRYLLSFLLILLSHALNMFVERRWPGNHFVQLVLSVVGTGCVIFSIVMTFRFTRALKIGMTWAIINSIFCPFVFIIQIIVLLRMYVKRTGTQLSFFMGDKISQDSTTA